MRTVAMTPDGTSMMQADDKLLVRFYLMEELNEAKTAEAGMNKYNDVQMVEILIPGCRDNVIRKATDQDKARFRRQYETFLNTKGEGMEGTPLSHFPFVSPSERKELEYFNIYTGEGLVGLSDGYLEKIPMDLRPLMKKVKSFMDYAKDNALVVKQAAENDALKEKIDLLTRQMQTMMSNDKERPNGYYKNENDPNEQKSRRGRPRRGNSNEGAVSFDA